jgi:hypothetical protein
MIAVDEAYLANPQPDVNTIRKLSCIFLKRTSQPHKYRQSIPVHKNASAPVFNLPGGQNPAATAGKCRQRNGAKLAAQRPNLRTLMAKPGSKPGRAPDRQSPPVHRCRRTGLKPHARRQTPQPPHDARKGGAHINPIQNDARGMFGIPIFCK